MGGPTSRGRRVLFLADRFPPRTGAAARSLAGVLAQFPGADAILSTPRRRGAGAVDRTLRCQVRRARTFVGPHGLGLRLWETQVRWLVRRREPSVIVACGVGPEAMIAHALHRERGIPFVLRLESAELTGMRADIQTGAESGQRMRALADEAAAIIVPTRTAWLEAYKLHTRPHDLQEIPPGVDLERYRPGKPAADVASRLALGKGPLVLAISDDDPAVDPETIFRAFAVVRSQLRRAVLAVSGMGEGQWRPLLESLKIDRGVRFVNPEEFDLPELYRCADLFLTAHRDARDPAGGQQGTELSFVEALGSGVPVVATRTPATEELAPDEEASILEEPGAHAKLGKTATDVLRSQERREELGRQGRERAEAHYDARRTAAQLGEFLEVLVVRRLRREPLAPDASGAAVDPAA